MEVPSNPPVCFGDPPGIGMPDSSKTGPDGYNLAAGSLGDNPKCQESSGALLRARSREDELKKYFDLPLTETLMDDFHCALRKRILLQGRMYVFEHFVCFYSNVLGFVKKRVIQLRDVANVKKKTNFRFPNSIEIEVRGQRRDFYTSFLSREDAYTKIYGAWQQCRLSTSDLDNGGTSARRTSSSLRRAMSHDVAVLEGALEMHLDGSIVKSQTEGAEGLVCRTNSGDDSNRASYETDDACSDRDEEEEEEDGGPLVWCIEDGEVPSVPKTCKPVVAVEFACSVREFFDRVMSNDSHFFEDFHSSQGDRRILLTSWRGHEQMGHVRELQFISPIRGAFANWGTNQTQCHQTQRFVVYKGDHVLFESSQVMTDIPYGDHFSVDTRWDVTPLSDDPARCSIKIYMHCVFTKKCMFRAIIESGSFKQTQEMFQLFFQQARQILSRPRPLTPISIRDKSFHSPQSRAASISHTPKDGPSSPSHANQASTSFARAATVPFTPTAQQADHSSLSTHGSQGLGASPAAAPRMASMPGDLQARSMLPNVRLPPRSRSVSFSKTPDPFEVANRNFDQQNDEGNKSLLGSVLRGAGSFFQSLSMSSSLVQLVVLVQVLLILAWLWRWLCCPIPPADIHNVNMFQRLGFLQQEVKLLHLRLEIATAEISALTKQLEAGVSAAAMGVGAPTHTQTMT